MTNLTLLHLEPEFKTKVIRFRVEGFISRTNIRLNYSAMLAAVNMGFSSTLLLPPEPLVETSGV